MTLSKYPTRSKDEERTSEVDGSMITGESLRVTEYLGEDVVGSTINKHGIHQYEATKVGKDTVLARMIKIVMDTHGSIGAHPKIFESSVILVRYYGHRTGLHRFYVPVSHRF